MRRLGADDPRLVGAVNQIKGGPLLLGALLYVLFWLLLRIKPAPAPSFGPAMSVAYGATAMMLGPSLLPPFLGMAFYFIGWMAAQKSTQTQTLDLSEPWPSIEG